MGNTDSSRPSAASATASAAARGLAERRRRSFRTRIALHSVLSSGIVLAVFGLSAWLTVRAVSLRRVDGLLVDRGNQGLKSAITPERLADLERPLRPAYHEDPREPVVVLASDTSGTAVYVSPGWPRAVPTALFAAAAADRITYLAPPPRDGTRSPGPPPRPPSRPTAFTRSAGGYRWRFATVCDGHTALTVGAHLEPLTPEIPQTAAALLASLPAALVFIGVMAWLTSGRALSPLRDLTAVAEKVTAEGLDQRIPAGDEDAEFLRLVIVFNGMMDRLERSFRQATRFSADAAHELRTPLAILQAGLAAALQTAEPEWDERLHLSELFEETQRLKAIVRNLLLLAQADAGQLRPDLKPHDLSAAVAELAEETELDAEGMRVAARIAPGVWVAAEAGLLAQVLRNLAGNATKYGHPGGDVRFDLEKSGAVAALRVTNTGADIPPEDAERIFDRFFRGDESRSRGTDGVGLGLSLSREIARAHGGDLRLESSAGGVTTFLLTLPAS